MKTTILMLALAALLAAAPATGKNVDLVTLPDRDTVQLTIYNSEDLTLVKETRSISLKKGLNKLQFSWANTLIDPTSVTFRPLEQKDNIELLDTVLPGQKPQHLVWNIDSKFEGQAKVEVTYFTSGLTWSMDYNAIADPDETKLHFRGYVRVFNSSGEEYDDAEVRLIVGTINLVEKIADLARRRNIPAPQPATAEYEKLRREALAESLHKADGKPGGDTAGQAKPKEIIKEGLSEYFMFSVAGTETIPDGWSKRMQAVEAREVPFNIVYRMRAYQYGPRPVRFFIWQNDDAHKLGQSPLPDGNVNVFRENGADGLAFLGRQQIRYVPVKGEIEVNLGPDDLVVYQTQRMGTERLNFTFDHARPEHVVGWDEKTQWVDTVRNYRTKPIVFELRRQWAGDVEYDSEVTTTLYDYQTTETTFQIKARGKTQYPATVLVHHGANARQQRAKLLSKPATTTTAPAATQP